MQFSKKEIRTLRYDRKQKQLRDHDKEWKASRKNKFLREKMVAFDSLYDRHCQSLSGSKTSSIYMENLEDEIF